MVRLLFYEKLQTNNKKITNILTIQQEDKYHQGTTLSVKKLNIKSLGELKIPMLEIEKQRQIGRLYRQSMIQKDLLEHQAENISRLAAETIRRIEED